ncbi:type II toxin-antitoxin system PemK/MazF family toxin [Solwaraspora sp. WMMB335]|uniref:type II toxin-antitoxin system PemK/MazF family toxin n=1 Tax=Solwaraspora sp. WMMB335 TaxID=3404118 RepID=UPI003B963A30
MTSRRFAEFRQRWTKSVRGDVYRLRAPRDAVGHEQQGRRYAVVVQSDDLNLSTTVVAPTSTSAHPYVFRPEVTVRGEPTRLMLDQLRAVDVEKTIGDRVGRLSPAEMIEINRLLRAVLDVL